MKRIVAVIIILMFATPALFAQETLREVVREYQDNNSEFTFVIPSFMIKMGLAFGEMEEEDREILEMLDDMKIIICQNDFQKNDFALLDKGIKSGKFTEVMTVNNNHEKVRMVVNKKSERKSEMLMLVQSDDENVLMLFNFHGDADFKKFLSLASKN
ncbi:MAG: hypothetical protein A2W99_11615 [Bacteroidetes bacterium GWF2_33_16]|nr:MAG: hypothetical protein A2X00_02660 [Bacteroidetes bacterium GWE2_32_14]OFY06349.1 MAG: hypothetical protein A2W99_11615 [Bacteroidetes bacterium GWF2_33_16]